MFIHLHKYLMVLGLLISLVGCQPAGRHYLNALADKTTVISLPAADATPQPWRDLYLDIDHSITMADGAVAIKGTVGFANHPQIMYDLATKLKVSLFLLDSRNRVVAYRQLLYSSFASTQDRESFEGHLDRPVGAVAYTFGYEVNFAEGEPDMGGMTVWSLPKVDR